MKVCVTLPSASYLNIVSALAVRAETEHKRDTDKTEHIAVANNFFIRVPPLFLIYFFIKVNAYILIIAHTSFFTRRFFDNVQSFFCAR